MSSTLTILQVEASMMRQDSTSRLLSNELAEHLASQSPDREVTRIRRDLADGIAFINQQWIQANFVDPEERSPEQQAALSESDIMVNELRQADVLIMSVPIYNFGPPAAFKAWIDQIARARETFRYSDKGPVGLLANIPTFLIVSSGGTAIGSEMDFVTAYIKTLFSFLGITDIEVIPCAGLMTEGEEVLNNARAKIAAYNLQKLQ